MAQRSEVVESVDRASELGCNFGGVGGGGEEEQCGAVSELGRVEMWKRDG